MNRKCIICLFIVLIVSLCGCSSSSPSGGSAESLPDHQIYLDIDFEQNLVLATYDVEVYIDDTEIGTIKHGGVLTHLTTVKEGTHTITFYKATDNSVYATKNISVVEDSTYKFRIHSNASSIEIKESEMVSGISGNAIAMIDVVGLTYGEAQRRLEDAGFVNIKYKTPHDETIWDSSAWEITSQNVKSGEEIDKTTEIVLSCDRPQDDNSTPSPSSEPTPTSSPKSKSASFHSSDNLDTAKNGSSGVFAYRNRGGSYYVYYIINFDEGYVYSFCEGNGDTVGDKAKIVSGDLNDVLIVTYHDGDDVWSYGLHFKWKNQPDHLIIQDNDGYDLDFYSTDLNEAIRLLETKTITEY